MAGNVIDLVEKDGVYVATEDVNVKPPKPRKHERTVIHNTAPAADRQHFTVKRASKSAPLMEFIDGAKEGLSLLEHIIKRMA